jgi:hypothetical protein
MGKTSARQFLWVRARAHSLARSLALPSDTRHGVATHDRPRSFVCFPRNCAPPTSTSACFPRSGCLLFCCSICSLFLSFLPLSITHHLPPGLNARIALTSVGVPSLCVCVDAGLFNQLIGAAVTQALAGPVGRLFVNPALRGKRIAGLILAGALAKRTTTSLAGTPAPWQLVTPWSPTGSLAPSLTHSLTHSPSHSLTHSPSHSLTHSLTHWLLTGGLLLGA